MDHFDRQIEAKQGKVATDQQQQQQKLPQQQQQRAQQTPPQARQSTPTKPEASRPFHDMDFDFLKQLSYDDLQARLQALDPQMEQEIEELRKRYQEKRRPIIEAMDVKRK